MPRIVLDPVTRVAGHLNITVDLDSRKKVTAAYVAGNLFRGFENLMIGRDPRDAIHLTQRICGVCPVPHATAAVDVVEQAFGVAKLSKNAYLLRNLILASNIVSDHILQFYCLALPDFVKGTGMIFDNAAETGDYRFSAAVNATFIQHYRAALQMRRLSQEMTAIFAGKMPHIIAYAPGGVTQYPTSENYVEFRKDLIQLTEFINQVYIPDVILLAQTYADQYNIGRGPQNLLTFGAFPYLDASGNKVLTFKPGIFIKGAKAPAALDTSRLSEHLRYSRYNDPSGQHPSLGTTTPHLEKSAAYSWIKAPRLNGKAYETGALARMKINGLTAYDPRLTAYLKGVSLMDRHVARALESKYLVDQMAGWLNGVGINRTGYQPAPPTGFTGSCFGFTEAARGALGHWMECRNGAVTRYQIVTPTCWNGSPRDDAGVLGALETALVGTTVANIVKPLELLRIVRSFDPCIQCAVHLVDAETQQLRSVTVL